MKTLKTITSLLLVTFYLVATPLSYAATPTTRSDGVTVIHLDQYGGYFSANETLAGLKEGEYEIVITNKTNKLVGFQIQNFKTQETLDMFPLEVGETKRSKVTITTDGARFRCPINPTAWYDLDNIKAK